MEFALLVAGNADSGIDSLKKVSHLARLASYL